MLTIWIISFSLIHTTLCACDVGWIRFSSSCYLFHRSLLSWLDSSNYCLSHGAHLAKVESTGEKDFINGMIQSMNGQYWLDGTDDPTEGYWIWASTGKHITNNLWFPGEPNSNHLTNHEEDCMETNQDYDGFWNDENCAEKQYCICEKPHV